MATDGNGHMLLKWGLGILASLLTLSIVAIAGNLVSLNREMIGLMAWKTNLEAQDSALRNSLPRTEYEIERRYLSAELEQMRARISILERREP